MRRARTAIIGIGLCILAAFASPVQAEDQSLDAEDILTSLQAIKYNLLQAQKPNGSWEEAPWNSLCPPAGIGGQTALATWALLQAGQDPFSEPVHKAVNYLISIESQMGGTYNRSLRCMVLASLARIDPVGKYAGAMQRDVDLLLASRLPNGRWTYLPVSSKNQPSPDLSGIGDNSNSQFAVLALREATVAGAKVPPGIWREIRDYWRKSQCGDGGFHYRDPTSSSYGSMTGAGTASLFIAEDMMRGSQCCVGDLPEPIRRALDWLSNKFRATDNPGHGNYWLYWLYSVERVAETSGYRYFGTHDWFWEGAGAIVRAHREKRLNDFAGAPLSGPSFALIFLARSVDPLVCNKLEFGNTWNPNPLDAAHMTYYLASDVFERHLNWSTIKIDASLAMFHEAPILLITTKTWPAPGAEILENLKPKLFQFCESGGTLLIDHTCRPDKDFYPNLQAFLQSLWPGRGLQSLPANHPIYSAHFPLDNNIAFQGMTNGCREYVLVCDSSSTTDLSCVWQRGVIAQQPQAFQLAGNIFMYSTDKTFRARLEPRSRLTRSGDAASESLPIARLQHRNNWNPCPLALPMLSQVLVAQAGLGLTVSDAGLDGTGLVGQQVLWISGQGKMEWSFDQIQRIRKFINDGGAVLGEALMGDKDFTESLRRLAAGATMLAPRPIPDNDPLITGTFKLEAFNLSKMHYSRMLRWRKGITAPASLEGCKTGNRWGFIISPYDLTNGLTTARPFNALSYEPDDATRIAANCMLYFAAGF